MSHHIIDKFCVAFRTRQTHHVKLVEQEGDLVSVDLLHRPAIGALQPLIIKEQVLVRGKGYASFPAAAFGSFTNFANVCAWSQPNKSRVNGTTSAMSSASSTDSLVTSG